MKLHSATRPPRVGAFILCFALSHIIGAASARADEYYVAPNGSSHNTGSISSPLDLATALSGNSPARPGDTIWLRQGRYLGNFVSDLVGTPSAPIIVRQYPGERATIDADGGARQTPALIVRGSDTWYWGFEVTDSNPARLTSGGYNPPRSTSVWVIAPRTKFINMVVHDGEQGFGFWNPAVDSELYGNLVYNNGFDSDDRGHGHSIYVQNSSGIKKITDNILLNSFSFGIHAYTETGRIDNIQMKGNTVFNHGVLSAVSGAKANIYMGGGDDADAPVVQDNYLYFSPFTTDGRNLELRPSCFNGTVTGNYSAGGTALSLYCVSTNVSNNFFAGRVFTDATGGGNTYQSERPSGLRVFVRRNQYEAGRANITIFNWDLQRTVSVDVSSVGLPVGADFEVRDAQDFFGDPVASGRYDGSSIAIPMTGLTARPPVGNARIVPEHTAPEFGAFILIRTSGSTTPPAVPTATLSASPASISTGQSAMLSWSTSGATQVAISSGVGTVPTSGTASVSPTVTTTYTLTASSASGSVTKSATVTVQTPPPAVGSASFVRTDSSTLGNWKGAHGNAGYSLSAVATQLPAWAEASFHGESTYIWEQTTSDMRALEHVNNGRVAATWYSDSAFSIDVTAAGTEKRQVALYGVDWDAQSRSQTIEVIDIATNGVLDRRTMGGFSQGQYWIWEISGAIRFRLTRVSGPNAVISGLFFDATGGAPPATNTPPAVTLALSGTPVAPAALTLNATASDADGSVSSVRFYSDTTLLTTDTTAPYSFSWNGVAAGTYKLTAVATDNGNATTTSATVTTTVTPDSGIPTTASAEFVTVDAASGGDWIGTYGNDGQTIASGPDALPSYAQMTLRGYSAWMWEANPADSRALATAPGRRVAATWYSDSGFSIDVVITDGRRHRVTLYAIDWDAIGRAQTIEVLDAATDALLDQRTIENFVAGQYLQWNVTGSVRFRITRTRGRNAVISGIFFDDAATPGTNAPPTVTLATSGSFAAPAVIALSATASDGNGIRDVRFYAGSTLLTTDTTGPYGYVWSNVPAGVYTLTAVATDNLGTTKTSAPVSVTVTQTGQPGTAATFVRVDTATRGDWKGLYGGEGYSLAMEGRSLPSFAQVTMAGESNWTWQEFPTDSRALQRSTTGRIAATWYSDTLFDTELALSDGQTHRVALYAIDFDAIGRTQRIDIIDAVTNAVLDTRTVTNFSQGQYLIWQISGRVRIRVTKQAGQNGVVSGLFFGAP